MTAEHCKMSLNVPLLFAICAHTSMLLHVWARVSYLSCVAKGGTSSY